MNKQREIIYSQRREILEGISLKEEILGILKGAIHDAVSASLVQDQEPNLSGLLTEVKLRFGLEFKEGDASLAQLSGADLEERLYRKAADLYADKEKAMGSDLLRHLERMVFLQIIDSKWKDHLYAMDSLREGIGLRAYGQRDPLLEYKREAFNMFGEMIAGIEGDSVEMVFKLQAKAPERFSGAFSSVSKELLHPEVEQFQVPADEQSVTQGSEEGPADTRMPPRKPVQLAYPKIGRNDPCSCGSGKKYKKCCGK